MNRIAVLGPGGVGGFVAAALARADEPVLVVARESTAERIGAHGIELTSVRLGDFTSRPAVASELDEPGAILVVATKATGLDEALARVRQPPALVVPLLNGFDHMERLREHFGAERVAAGAIRIEAHRPAPGVIVQTSPFLRIDLASDQPAAPGELAELGTALERAKIPVRFGTSEAQILWGKLVRLNALALTTSAAGRPLGFIRSDPNWRAALEGAISEGAAVANAEGARLDPAVPLAELADAHAELRSSMQRDIAAGLEPELDAIAGSVLRAAARHGLDSPTIARLSAQVAERAGVPAPNA